MFILNSKLQEDTLFIGEMPLCSILLMNNKLYPWIILVPKRFDAIEIMDLQAEERAQLMEEIAAASKIMKSVYWPDKMNVAAIGNQVEQLHVHVIARFKTDDIWPEPVWGKASKPYTKAGKTEVIDILRREFNKLDEFATIANNP